MLGFKQKENPATPALDFDLQSQLEDAARRKQEAADEESRLSAELESRRAENLIAEQARIEREGVAVAEAERHAKIRVVAKPFEEKASAMAKRFGAIDREVEKTFAKLTALLDESNSIKANYGKLSTDAVFAIRAAGAAHEEDASLLSIVPLPKRKFGFLRKACHAHSDVKTTLTQMLVTGHYDPEAHARIGSIEDCERVLMLIS